MNTTIIAIHNSESLYEGIATTVNELLAADWIKDSDLISSQIILTREKANHFLP